MVGVVVVVAIVSHIQRSGCQPEKTTLHSGQSRSWSTEEGKENKIKSLAAHSPPPPTVLVRRKKKKNHLTHLQALRRSRSASRPYKDSFDPLLTRSKGRFAKFYASVCDNKFPSLVASLFSWRCLAAPTYSFLHVAMNLRPPSMAVFTHTSVFNTVAFQLPPLCQTPGCRSVRNRSTLSPSHPV